MACRDYFIISPKLPLTSNAFTSSFAVRFFHYFRLQRSIMKATTTATTTTTSVLTLLSLLADFWLLFPFLVFQTCFCVLWSWLRKRKRVHKSHTIFLKNLPTVFSVVVPYGIMLPSIFEKYKIYSSNRTKSLLIVN